MEIKATLNKPYNEDEKIDFIIKQNHNNGYEIRETETALEAWGKTEDETFEEIKKYKYAENQNALDKARVNHVFTVNLQGHECTFDTKDKTQSDLNSAMLSANAGYPWQWTTNNKIKINLGIEDIVTITNAFQELVNADIDRWTYYETLIDNATNRQELYEIDINYNKTLGDNDNDITD